MVPLSSSAVSGASNTRETLGAIRVLERNLVGDFGNVRDYRVAIAEVLDAGVSPRQSELLRAHLWAPGYSASSAELAEAVGYGSWRTANFQYGALAHRIAVELGVFQPPRGFWVNILINWAADPVRSPLGHARYSLRREVARALIDLGFAEVPPNPLFQRTSRWHSS